MPLVRHTWCESPFSHPDLRESFPARRNRAPAFTLVEVLITLSLLVLLASIAWPAMQSQITASQLPESAERVRSALAMARCEAVMEHRRFRIRFAKGDQQPKIEYESDPINKPGVYEASTADWVHESLLLADVQVHDIQPGRPVYLQALSTTTDPDAARKQAEKVQQDKQEREQLRAGFGQGAQKQETEDDPLRPAIIFEPDGSVDDWATLILARVRSEDTLEEDQPQTWIVLDGRTGLATVREKVTEEQLSDSKFYVQREKLELPKTANIDDLSFDINNDVTANGQATNGTDTLNGQGTDGNSPSLTEMAAGAGQQPQGNGQEIAAGEQQAGDGTSAVDEALKNAPNLSEEEKNNIRENWPKKTK